MGSSAGWRRQEKKSMNWKIEHQKLPDLNNSGKIVLKKTMIRASETCGTITKDLTFMLSGSPRRREREWGQRSPQETMAENPPNLARHKPTDSRS